MEIELRSYGRALQVVDVLRGAGFLDALLVERRHDSSGHVVRVSAMADLDELHVQQLVYAIDPEAAPR